MVRCRRPLLPFFTLCLLSPSAISSSSASSPTLSSASSFCTSSSSARLLVCSCSSSSSGGGHLYLSAAIVPDLLNQLVVHSCHRLTIASGTFRGKTILEHIKLLDIVRVDIGADAFRAIRRSPRLFLLQNVHLPALRPRTFTGLSRLQHFWWRNTTIGRVHENAFAKMALVDYLYFHTADIKIIDPGAFGHIHRLGHLFLRAGIRVGRAGARVFRGSRIGELVVEEASVKADAAVFDGLRAQRVRISDCWWGETDAAGARRTLKRRPRRRRRRRRLVARQEAVQIGEMLIRNCTMYRMPRLIGALISVFHVEHSHIGRLAKKAYNLRQNAIADDAQRHHPLQFVTSSPMVNNSSSNHFNSMPNRLLSKSWHKIMSSPLQSPAAAIVPLQLLIFGSNIRFLSIPCNVGTDSSGNLSNIFHRSVLIRNSSILRWVGSPFAMAVPFASPIRQFLIEDSRLAFVANDDDPEGPFAHLSVLGTLKIVRSQMGAQMSAAGVMSSPQPFGGSKIGILELSECHLQHAPDNALLQGVEVRERLTVRGTEWPCAGDHCGTEGLLLAPNSHPNLNWQFTSNRCFEEDNNNNHSSSSSSAFCGVPSSIPPTSSEFVCRQIGPLEECMCRGTLAHQSPGGPHQRRHILPLPSSTALLFLIGDCAEHSLVLHSSDLASVQSLYIFRVGQLIIRSIPPSLRHLNILHSSVIMPNAEDAFAGTNLFELAVDGSHLEGPLPPVPMGGGTLRRKAQVARIRLEGVNDAWTEVAKQLAAATVPEEHRQGGTDTFVEDGTLSPEGMVIMPRRRGVPSERNNDNEEVEEWEEEMLNNGQKMIIRTRSWMVTMLVWIVGQIICIRIMIRG